MRPRSTTVIVKEQRRIGDPRHRLRLTGPTLAEYRQFDPEMRHSLLSALAIPAISRIGHRHRLLQLQSRSADELRTAVDVLLSDPASRLSESLLNDLLAPIIEPTWHEFVECLGGDSLRPSAERIAEVGHLVSQRFSIAHVRLFLSAAVEIGLPSRTEIKTLDPRHVAFAPHLPAVSPASAPPVRNVPTAGEERREERRLRRAERRKQRALARTQRADRAGRRGRARQASTRAFSDSVSSVSSSIRSLPTGDEAPTPEPLQHPHLPDAATQRSESPIAHRGSAHIRWGAAREKGKVRPVLIVGASSTHLWIRPIYTRDLVAGRWRSVTIHDWRTFGLDHESFVSIKVVRIPRHQCTVTSSVMTTHDWNRVCRGEVH